MFSRLASWRTLPVSPTAIEVADFGGLSAPSPTSGAGALPDPLPEGFDLDGFLGGLDGVSVALSAAINAYLKYAKLLEFQRDAKVRDAEDFDRIW